MPLRWLVNTWVRQAARDKIREAMSQVMQSQAGQSSTEQPPAGQGRGAEPQGADAAPAAPPPPCDIAVIFALDLEAGGLVDLLGEAVGSRWATFFEHVGNLDGRRIAIVESGVGAEAAARATEDVIDFHKPGWVISAGFAGALSDQLRRGHFLMPDSVVDEAGHVLEIGLKLDSRTVQSNPSLHTGRLLTVARLVREPAERRELAEKFGAVACDMETAAVAEVCRSRQTRFLAVRIISDAVDDQLPPEIQRLLNQKSLAGKLGAATGAIVNRPSAVKDMWKLREEALKAADRLAGFLRGVVAQLNGENG